MRILHRLARLDVHQLDLPLQTPAEKMTERASTFTEAATITRRYKDSFPRIQQESQAGSTCMLTSGTTRSTSSILLAWIAEGPAGAVEVGVVEVEVEGLFRILPVVAGDRLKQADAAVSRQSLSHRNHRAVEIRAAVISRLRQIRR